MVDFNYYKEVKLIKLRSQLISTLSNKQRKDLCRVYKINNGYKKHSQCWNFVLNDNIKNKLKQDYNIVTDYIYMNIVLNPNEDNIELQVFDDNIDKEVFIISNPNQIFKIVDLVNIM